MFTTTGLIIYDPPRPKLKRKNGPWWCIVQTDPELARYYRWWVWARWKIALLRPAWGAHITVCNGKQIPKAKRLWRRYHGCRVEFQYSHWVEKAWHYFYVKVWSDDLLDLREELGLDRYYPLHITIGRLPEWDVAPESRPKRLADGR